MIKDYIFKQPFVLFSLFFFFFQAVSAQVGIGTTVPRGALEIASATQGFVPPQVALTANNVAGPVVNPQGGAIIAGTIVYNTATAGVSPNNVIPGYYFWNGSLWVSLSGGPGSNNWTTTGNSGTSITTNFIGTTDAVDFVTRTNNTEKMRVTSGGNLGIGTTSPNAPLQFANTLSNRKIVLLQDVNNDNEIYGFGINNNILRYQVSGTTKDHVFYAGASATTSNELMRIKGTGNVGVGLNNPNGKLHLFEPIGTTLSPTAGSLILEHGNSGGQSSILFKSNVNAGSDYGYIRYSDDGSGNGSTTENSLLEIGVQNDGANTSQDDIALMPTGNVGIGTTTPTNTLDVNGGATLGLATSRATFNSWYPGNTAFWINLPTSGPSGIGTGGAGVNPWFAYSSNAGEWFTNALAGDIAYRNTTGKMLFGNTSGNAGMALSNNRLGIGTITPNASLHVNGTTAFTIATSGTANTVILQNAGTFTPPVAAAGNSGVMYIIRNTSTTTDLTVATTIPYNSATSGNINVTPVIGSITIISNGTNWYRID